jgi:hypothetical protein
MMTALFFFWVEDGTSAVWTAFLPPADSFVIDEPADGDVAEVQE